MKKIVPEMLDELTALFVDTFNAPPWNDEWKTETARTRLRDIMRGFAANGEHRQKHCRRKQQSSSFLQGKKFFESFIFHYKTPLSLF